jgi:putative phage-type endonuclease
MDDISLPDATAHDHLTREAWLATRRQSLGASDAPIALGLSPYKSPLTLYVDKLGLDPGAEEESEPVRWGHLLEGVIRKEYAHRVGREIAYVPLRIYRSREYAWMSATLDGLMLSEAGPGVLEIKTTHPRNELEWAEEPPEMHQIQVQHQLSVTGCTWGVIVVLIGGQQLRCYPVARNEPFIAGMRERLFAFWASVQTRTPPAIDGSRAARTLLKALYPREEPGKRITLPGDALHWDAVLQATGAEIATLEAEHAAAKARLQQMIGDAEIAILPDGSGHYTWKRQTRKAYTVPAGEQRKLLRHNLKEGTR